MTQCFIFTFHFLIIVNKTNYSLNKSIVRLQINFVYVRESNFVETICRIRISTMLSVLLLKLINHYRYSNSRGTLIFSLDKTSDCFREQIVVSNLR